MSSIKPNLSVQSKGNSRLNSILSKARSTLNHSQQFRSSTTSTNPIDDNANSSVEDDASIGKLSGTTTATGSSTKQVRIMSNKISKLNQIRPDKYDESDENDFSLSIQMSRASSKDNLINKKDVVPRPSSKPSTSKSKPAASFDEHDYDMIFNSDAKKKSLARSNFNIYSLAGNHDGPPETFISPPPPPPPLPLSTPSSQHKLNAASFSKKKSVQSFKNTKEKAVVSTGGSDMTKVKSTTKTNANKGDQDMVSEYSYGSGNSTDASESTTITPPTVTESYSKAGDKRLTVGKDVPEIVTTDKEKVFKRIINVLKHKSKPTLTAIDLPEKHHVAKNLHEVLVQHTGEEEFENDDEIRKSRKSDSDEMLSEVPDYFHSETFTQEQTSEVDGISFKTESDLAEAPQSERSILSTVQKSNYSIKSRESDASIASENVVIVTDFTANASAYGTQKKEHAKLKTPETAASVSVTASRQQSTSESKQESSSRSAQVLYSVPKSGQDDGLSLRSKESKGKDQKRESVPSLAASSASQSQKASLPQKKSLPNSSKRSFLKMFQTSLSKVTLNQLPIPAEQVEQYEDVFKYKGPKTKTQARIHTILAKEVYLKELNRLRRQHLREERELQILAQQRMRNLQTLQEIQTEAAKYSQPILNFPRDEPDEINWGAPYFNKDGGISEGHHPKGETVVPTGEDYISRLHEMNMPQLVKEVTQSNERMYLMTIQAAKEMSRNYRIEKKIVKKMSGKSEKKRMQAVV